MPRRLVTLAAVASLVLCLAALALWVRSYWRADQVGWYENRWDGTTGVTRAVGFDSDSGGVVLFLLHREASLDLRNATHAWFQKANPNLSQPSWIVHAPHGYPYMTHYQGAGTLGFGYFAGAPNRTDLPMVHHDRFVVIPAWLTPALAALLPGWWARAWFNRRSGIAKVLALCRTCGYDLRATPARCPECGAAPAAAAAR